MKIENTKKIETIHTQAYFRFLHTANYLELTIKEVLQPYKLTHSQYNILRILRGSKHIPLAANEIKDRMIVPSPDVTRLIDRLVKKGLVHRQTCPENRRKVDITIKPKGLELLTTLDPQMHQIVTNCFEEKISNQEAAIFNKILNKILETT